MPETSDFWNAVKTAHRLGHTGNGVTIAVIDSGFDTSYPALADASLVFDNDPAALPHGTAVALLIKRVAPDSKLLLFPVSRNGRADGDLLAKAFHTATEAGADVINASLGLPIPVPETIDLTDVTRNVADWRGLVTIPPTAVGRAAAAAAASGATVVAACGNRSDRVFVPAAEKSVIAVGFFTFDWNEGDGGMNTPSVHQPDGYAESRFFDLKLEQPSNVLGSSFATPLMSGFIAISPHRDAIHGYNLSSALSSAASILVSRCRTAEDAALLGDFIANFYDRAFQALPHLHLSPEKPGECPTCAYFARALYADAGLWHLNLGDLPQAELLFRAVLSFLPGNTQATQNLAVTLAARVDAGGPPPQQRRELLDEAIGLMESVATAHPDREVYAWRLHDLRAASQNPALPALTFR